MLPWIWRQGYFGRRWDRRRLSLIALPFLLLAGCAQDSGAARTPVTSGVPRFEPVECTFSSSRWSGFECGDLVVLENRNRADSPIVRLRVAILRSGAESPETDPLIFLSGGRDVSTGASTVEWFEDEVELYQSILRKRDIIYFDQRGAGYSRPLLDCPEVSESMAQILDLGWSASDWARERTAALLACRQRLVDEGIDLSAYNSAASAADVNDLRHVLGYEQVNLMGLSYGSRLALTIMRDFPATVRSVILDSPVPLQADALVRVAPDFQASLDLVLERCAADEACAAAYPDLESTLDALLARLDQEPVAVQVPHPVTGSPVQVPVDGDAYMKSLLMSLYFPDVIYRLPKLISDSYKDTSKSKDRLAYCLEVIFNQDEGISEGQDYSVRCFEEIPFNSREAALAQYADVNQWLRATLEPDILAEFAICEAWDVGEAPAVENEAVHSEIPTLVLTGEFDPVTPPYLGDLVVETLPNANHLEFPYSGHATYFMRRCARQLVAAFVEDPAAPLDLSCLEALQRQPPEFVTN